MLGAASLQELQGKIVKYLTKFVGKINYVTRVSPDTVVPPLTWEQIADNLNRFKRSAEVELHLAQRPAGAFDVIFRSWAEGLEYKYSYQIGKTVYHFTYPKGCMDSSEGEEFVKTRFKKQGYFKTWKARGDQVPLPSGIAPESVWNVTYLDSIRYLLRVVM